MLASNNPHKLSEMQAIAALAAPALTVEWLRPADLGLSFDVEEVSTTYLGNARLKARALAQQVGSQAWVLSDDSGLEVDALGGRPGVHSAQYCAAAENGDGCAALLRELQDTPAPFRTARFRCVLVSRAPNGSEHVVEGVVGGFISERKCGTNGFGFDPVFVPSGETRTFAEMSATDKHRLSHRGIAVRALLLWLSKNSPHI